MTRPVRSLWRNLAALLLLATVPAAAILPPPAPPRPAPVELGAEVLERLDQAAGDVVAVALAVCELHPAKPPRAGAPAPALARWGPKPHVGASALAGGRQHQVIQWFSCEIAVALSYDADGVRVRTEVVPAGGGAAEVTEYLVDTSGPLSQVVVEGSTTAAVGAVYVRGDDLLAVLRPDGGGGGGGGGAGGMVARFYHADGLGSVRALTDEVGAVTDRWDFSAFGELLAHVGDDPQAYLFAGEALDPNVGWYYNRARWMDPAVGRFGSVDPLLRGAATSVALLPYSYVNANPVQYRDPSGLVPDWLVRVLVGTAVHALLYEDFIAKSVAVGGDPYANREIHTILGVQLSNCMVGGDFDTCRVRPDLVEKTTREVYEIKTVKERALGAAQLAGYIALLTINSPLPPWKPGRTYQPRGTLIVNVLGSSWTISVNPPVGGVITYSATSVSLRVHRVVGDALAAAVAVTLLASLTIAVNSRSPVAI